MPRTCLGPVCSFCTTRENSLWQPCGFYCVLIRRFPECPTGGAVVGSIASRPEIDATIRNTILHTRSGREQRAALGRTGSFVNVSTTRLTLYRFTASDVYRCRISNIGVSENENKRFTGHHVIKGKRRGPPNGYFPERRFFVCKMFLKTVALVRRVTRIIFRRESPSITSITIHI